MYLIRDTQFQDRYFAGGVVFNNKQEVCKQLINYHSNDCDMSQEQKLLDEGKIDECLNLLCGFEWKLIKVCEHCYSPVGINNRKE